MKRFFSTIFFFALILFPVFSLASDQEKTVVDQGVNICVIDSVCGSLENGNSCPMDCSIVCDDNLDNDSDGFADFPDDSDCATATGTSEVGTTPPGGGGGFDDDDSGGESSGSNEVEFSNLVVVADVVSAEISWETEPKTTSTVSWGETPDYEMGTLVNANRATAHQAAITGLNPKTWYYFKIVAETNSGDTKELTGEFSTKNSVPEEIAQNISNLQLTRNGEAVLLSWKNPADPNFSAVRIVRKHDGYPEGPFDGGEVYTGNGEFVLDNGVSIGNRYYYGVFSVSDTELYSSGVLASIYLDARQKPVDEENDFEDALPGEEKEENVETGNENDGKTDEEEDIPEDTSLIDLSDFLFVQGKNTIFANDSTVSLRSRISFSVLISNTSIPENVDDIVIARMNLQNGKETNYLLRSQEEREVRSAELPAYFESGKYPFRIFVVYHNGDYRVLKGSFDVSAGTGVPLDEEEQEREMFGIFSKNLVLIGLILLFVLFSLFFIFSLWKRRKNNREETLNIPISRL